MGLGEFLEGLISGLSEEERAEILAAASPEVATREPPPGSGGEDYAEGPGWAASPPEFSNASLTTENEFAQAKALLNDLYGIPATQAGTYINWYAQSFYNEHGDWPSAGELYSDSEFLSGAQRVRSGASALPTYFWGVDDEGNRTLYNNHTIVGPYPVPITEMAAIYGTEMPGRDGAGRLPLYLTPGGPPSLSSLPTFTMEQLLELFSSRPGGGGGGGGGGSVGPIFDRNLVIENITNKWRSLLLEEPGTVGQLADNYIAEAKAFARRGGSLSLETWTLGKIRDTGRYKTLYGKKPESLSEDQYIGQYRQTVTQFGMNEHESTRQIKAGMRSGAGIAGFAERVSGTSQAMLSNQGGWSQRFAQSVASMGLAGRMG